MFFVTVINYNLFDIYGMPQIIDAARWRLQKIPKKIEDRLVQLVFLPKIWQRAFVFFCQTKPGLLGSNKGSREAHPSF